MDMKHLQLNVSFANGHVSACLVIWMSFIRGMKKGRELLNSVIRTVNQKLDSDLWVKYFLNFSVCVCVCGGGGIYSLCINSFW
jgi:hypothetical protein